MRMLFLFSMNNVFSTCMNGLRIFNNVAMEKIFCWNGTYAWYKIFTQIANFNYANNFERMEDFFFSELKKSYVS